jgi:hypothetical protein
MKDVPTLTSKDRSKIRQLVKTQDADNVDFACNLLASLNASEEDWLSLFPKTRIFELLSKWEPKIWNTLASALRSHARPYEILKLQAQDRVNSRRADINQTCFGFLIDLIKVANDDVIDVLSFAKERLKPGEISDTVALKLANYKGALELEISSLSDTPGHIALAKGLAVELTFDYLCQLSAKAAEALVARNRSGSCFRNYGWKMQVDELPLENLKTLSADAAAALAKYKGKKLRFNELETLSVDAAKNLAKFNGDLAVNGIKLSDEAIASLANKKGKLELEVSELSAKVAKALALHDGDLELSIKKLSDDICVLLATHKGQILIIVPWRTSIKKDYKISARGAEAFLDHGNAFILPDRAERRTQKMLFGFMSQEECAAFLRKTGAKPNISIHQAAVKMIELLIAEGKDVNAKTDLVGSASIHFAALHGRKEIVELLITRGADVNAKNTGGKTPLDWACNKQIKDLLRKQGGKTGEELKAEGK